MSTFIEDSNNTFRYVPNTLNIVCKVIQKIEI